MCQRVVHRLLVKGFCVVYVEQYGAIALIVSPVRAALQVQKRVPVCPTNSIVIQVACYVLRVLLATFPVPQTRAAAPWQVAFALQGIAGWGFSKCILRTLKRCINSIFASHGQRFFQEIMHEKVVGFKPTHRPPR